MSTENNNEPGKSSDFLRTIIKEDIAAGRFEKIITRFPPEPNGYIHIGHAKAICINFGIAAENNGYTNLRFDDTNPAKEEQKFVDSITEDIKWLGLNWKNLYFASDYFDQLFDFAVDLIKKDKAFVCDLSSDEIREYRGTLTEPGKNSPYRNRTIEENLELFTKMKNGDFEDGSKTLRAKIDMSSGNINFRDPIMYRILRAHHHRTGDKWCIYPTYDWTHGQSDSIEKISHSMCSLEFEDHRPLYDWYIKELGIYPSRQIEFSRLNINYNVLSKRKMKQLVDDKHVEGWDDPRMLTLSGLRRRGYSPLSIRNFCDKIGIAKRDSMVDFALLEHTLREDLNKQAQRVMGVLNPLKVVITNYPEDKIEKFEAINNPENENDGTREIEFSREIYIEREDFLEDPPKKFFRLGPGREVRLKHAYYITCDKAIKDDNGEITEIHCTYDPESRGGSTPDNRRVKGTLHWVSTHNAVDAEIRLYSHLFTKENPLEDEDFTSSINPDSLIKLTNAKIEPSLKEARPDEYYQFLRHGYFCVDSKNSTPEKPVFNRTVTLRDSWAKIAKK